MAISIPNALSAVLQKIPDLDSTNWSKWSKGMNLFFLGVGAEFITAGTAPTATETDKLSLDKQLLPYIYGKVSEEYQYLVEDGTSAVQVWKDLKAQFEKTSMSNRITARQELYRIEHDSSRDIAVYLYEIKTAVARLKALGITVPEQEQKDIILMNLHPSFHTARGVILTAVAEPDLKAVQDLLTTTAASDPSVKVEPMTSQLSFAARRMNTSSANQSGSIGPHGFPVDAQNHHWCDPTNTDCHRCGRPGHIALKCMHSMPQFVKDWIQKNANSSSPSNAFAAALAAGYTPEMFAQQYANHVGPSSHSARSAAALEAAHIASLPVSFYQDNDSDDNYPQPTIFIEDYQDSGQTVFRI